MTEPEATLYDLFVSYAHADNYDGWVRQFVEKLAGAMSIRNGGDPLRIYFDTREVQANSVLEDMLAAARKSKLFLAVGSRAYIERNSTKLEMQAFCEVNHDLGCFFVIETLPLLPGRVWPEPIHTHTRQCFFQRDETDGTESPLSPQTDSSRFLREVNKLAEHIVRKLREVEEPPVARPRRPARARATPAAPAPAPELGRKRVLIAQPTEALEDAAQELRGYLTQFQDGVEVLPESPYPQGGAEFRAAYLLDLDRADLVVQLLDQRPGRRPPDLPEGYTMFQWNAARSHGVEVMHWRHPSIDVAGVADEDFRAMLSEPTVVSSGLQEFMASVRKRALDPVAKDRPKNGAVVYVHASPNDMDTARRIGLQCDKYRLFCHLPQLNAKTINIRDVQERLSTSNAVLFLYCDAGVDWARREAEEVWKYSRRDSGQIVALCLGPPPDKPSMNVVFPGARIIDSPDEDDFFRQIDSLLKELVA